MDVTEQAEGQIGVADVPHDDPGAVEMVPAVEVVPAEVETQSGPAVFAAPETQVLPPDTITPPPIGRVWLRLAYVFEFWIALIAVSLVWSQVSGQDLDVMPWYFKLFFPIALALSVVRMTVAIAEKPAAWNSKSAAWLLAVLVVVTLMSIVSYWYHLHGQEDQGTDENSVTTVRNWSPERNALRGVIRRGRENC